MDAPPHPPRVVSELPPKHRPRSRPTRSACIIHSGTAPPIHGSETLSEPAARQTGKWNPATCSPPERRPMRAQICCIFERNSVQGTSEVVGRGQAKESQAKPSRPLLKKAAISSSRRAPARETPSHQPEAWDDWGYAAVRLLTSGTSTVDAPLIPSSIRSKYPSHDNASEYGHISPTYIPPPIPPRSAVRSVSTDRIPTS